MTAAETTAQNAHMASAEEDVQMTREDQERITRFSTLNHRFDDLGKQIEEKEKLASGLGDAAEEVMMCMDPEGILYRFGDSFLPLDEDEATEKLEGLKSLEEAALRSLKDEIEQVKTEMDTTKKDLYAKFGDSINLEK